MKLFDGPQKSDLIYNVSVLSKSQVNSPLEFTPQNRRAHDHDLHLVGDHEVALAPALLLLGIALARAAWRPQLPIFEPMELFDLPLYAVQRLADGTWLVRTPMGDPILPPVDVVAVLDEPTSTAPRVARLEQQDATTGQIGA